MKKIKVLLVFAAVMVLLAACAGPAGPAGPEGPQGPAGPEGPQGPAGEAVAAAEFGCPDCHNATSIITAKQFAWEESAHGIGYAAGYAGGRASCAGCHSGTAFQEMEAAGVTNPDELQPSSTEPTSQDCRACHNIHMTYTGEDWALTTTDAVVMYAFEDLTYDGGKGNLCANCHQPRRQIESVDGVVNVSSTHWGPHHGPQTAVLLGVGGYGAEGSAAGHYGMVEDTCVACHLSNHAFEPSVAACTDCHADAENFDINGLQTEVEEKLETLAGYLEEAGLWDGEEGHPVVGEYPEDQAGALWNYILIAVEDSSHGVHNPNYVNALLDYSISVFEQ